VGDLPPDFLRVTSNAEQRQIAADRQQAAMLQAGGVSVFTPTTSRLSITVAQARLNKNYGLTKMDPYCRVRVGHSVFETHTCPSGGKTPVWNKVIHAGLPAGVDSVYIEIFDERSFTMDDRVAWTHITIPDRVMTGETVDDWFPLNGKLGDKMEGTINLVLSYNRVASPPVQRVVYTTQGMMPMYAPVYGQPGSQPVMVVPAGTMPPAMPMYYGYPPGAGVPAGMPPMPGMMPVQQPVQQPPARQPVTDDDVAVVKDMFPNVEADVIRSILEVNNGDKDATINNLLAMETS